MRKFTIAGAVAGGFLALSLVLTGAPAKAQDVETGKKMYAGMYALNVCGAKLTREQWRNIARYIISETGYIPTSSDLRAIKRSVTKRAGVGACQSAEYKELQALVEANA
jgi:hypothetical protein